MMLTESLHTHMQILSVHHKFNLIENKNKVTEETYIESKYKSNYHHSKGKLKKVRFGSLYSVKNKTELAIRR